MKNKSDFIWITHQKGFSLIELMVSLVIGIVIMTGVLKVYATTVNGNAHSIMLSRVSQEIRSVLDIMKNDIQRSGYWRDATMDDNNPFGDIAINEEKNCLSYTYDANNNGGDVENPNDEFGFRLNNGAVQMRTNANACDNPDNTTDIWQNITDPETVTITNLTFSKIVDCTNMSTEPYTPCSKDENGNYIDDNIAPSPGDSTINITTINIGLQAQSKQNQDIAMILEDSTMLRNEVVSTVPN